MQTATMYTDLGNGQRETVFFFMLNAYLNSRIDTASESDGDEDVNMYMASLLESLVDGRFYLEHADSLAATPIDVLNKIEDSDSDRRRLDVYRTNADHRLVAFGLFAGWGEHTSLYRKNTTPNDAYLEQAQQYYSWAAVFCARLPSRYRGLSCALEKIAARFETYLTVLAHMRSHYFDMLERLSVGEAYHMERRAHEAALPVIEEQTLDRMLDAYSDWKAEPSAQNRQVLREESGRYQVLNADFQPECLGIGATEDDARQSTLAG